ncbi:M48 family metalloprotease [Caenimonas koreensis DSM 17982]|uniref:M48 family metalloprotease n=2 Tax=Caenimonas TaxID=763439 RepID=A0A844BAJ6_9BURK|nr:M48 family metalloprotease [Caenimonas koreensis DSM 17982]
MGRLRPALLVLSVAGAVLPLVAAAQLPSLGDSGDMNTSAERKMGQKIARELFRDPDYIEDPVLDEYVLDIWKRLLAAARQRGELTPEMDERFAWEVLLGKDRTINAFALPGGWLGLHLGLISVTATRDELASVLAHELSHVTQRHISRLMAQEAKQAPLMLAAMILGAIAMSKSADAGNALLIGGQALATQNSLNFSRDMEREADRVGYGVLTQAGFEPQGFVGMFEKLQAASRLSDSGNFPYLRTHPMTTERIAEAQSRLQLGAPRPAPPPDLVHTMMMGRARVLSNPGVDVLRGYVSEPGSGSFNSLGRARQAGSLYSAALAHAKLRDFPQAHAALARLGPLVAGDAPAARQVSLLASEIAFQEGDLAQAVQVIDKAAKTRPELIYMAQAQIKSGRAADAAQLLQTQVAVSPRDAQAWLLLSSAYSAQGLTLRAIRADAEARVAQLDYQAAMDRFRAAQDLVRKGNADHIEASIIDSRARAVDSLLREQALER